MKSSDNKIPYWERVKATYKTVSNSPEYQKNNYSSRVLALYFFLFCFIFMVPAFLADKILGLPSGIACVIAGIAAFACANNIAKNKTAQKFEDK